MVSTDPSDGFQSRVTSLGSRSHSRLSAADLSLSLSVHTRRDVKPKSKLDQEWGSGSDAMRRKMWIRTGDKTMSHLQHSEQSKKKSLRNGNGTHARGANRSSVKWEDAKSPPSSIKVLTRMYRQVEPDSRTDPALSRPSDPAQNGHFANSLKPDALGLLAKAHHACFLAEE
ncbi:hypothetical protein BYT27DRAFT_7252268 [Phlegmacium glaucopus]|nr:hypothetical protein BYT27DRAFT_7252268 [Phlegmacium glaucopus]